MTTQIQNSLPLLESILKSWEPVIGEDYLGYRNHCYRMIHCCFALHNCSDDDKKKITIAAAFHDIGIWTSGSLDYIPPSIPLARKYLEENALPDWTEEVELMISEHHKLRTFRNRNLPLVEVFRKGDLVDFSMGLVSFGLPKQFIKELKHYFPNAGFHNGLLQKGSRWLLKHPLNPFPMMKW